MLAKRFLTSILLLTVIVLFQNCGQPFKTFSQDSASNQVAGHSNDPLSKDALVIHSPMSGSAVSGSIEVTGIAGSNWLNIAAFRSDGAKEKLSDDVSPIGNEFKLTVDVSKLPNPAKISIVAFSVAAGQPGGLSKRVDLSYQNNSTAPVWGSSPTELMLGVFTGNTPSEVTDYENWLGREVDGVLGFVGDANWADFTGSAGWAAGLWKPLNRSVFWSVPLIVNGANLEDAAAGKYNAYYKSVAESLATFRPDDPVLIVRTGWEFNGNWFPWSAIGKEDAYIGAYRQFVTTFRSVSSRFKFEWNVNVGKQGMADPSLAYPGDDYVDVIGMDFYWMTEYQGTNPTVAWNTMEKQAFGLKWHQDFAKAHGKPSAYSEWGVQSDSAGPYIQKAKDWFVANKVLYATYWDSNAAYPGKLSTGPYPNASNVYKQSFTNPLSYR